MALVVVFVVVVLLALAAYAFTETMLSELRAVHMAGRDAQAR